MLAHLRRHGALTIAASTAEPMSLPLGFMVGNDITLHGSLWFEREDIAELLAMIESSVLDLSVVRQQTVPLSEIERAFEAVTARPSGLGQVVLDCRA